MLRVLLCSCHPRVCVMDNGQDACRDFLGAASLLALCCHFLLHANAISFPSL